MISPPADSRAMCRIAVFALIAVLYFSIPNARPDFRKFNANDSEHYLALSYSLVHGIGYTRSMDSNYFVPHTTWPPGIPVLMMPAVALSGERISWLAVKVTGSLIGLLGIICVWFFARRAIHDERGADLAALFVGLNPIYWDFSHQAMAEGPLTVWIIASLLVVDVIWRDRRVRWWEALGSGCLIGLGMYIKGHAMGLIFGPLCFVLLPSRESSGRSHRFKMWCLFAAGFTIPFLLWVLRNSMTGASGFDGINQLRMLRSKNPLDFRSELLTVGETVNVMIGNFRHHLIHVLPCEIVPGLWSVDHWSLPGLFALGTSLFLGFLCLGGSHWQLSILSVILPILFLNLIYVFGGAERYYIPIAITMTIIISLRIWKWLSGRERFTRNIFVSAIVAVLVTNISLYVVHHEKHPYLEKGAFAQLAKFFSEVPEVNLDRSVQVLTTHQDAFKLMTGYKSAPVSMEEGGSSPLYDYVVLRMDGIGPAPPPGATCRFEEYPWGLYELPRPTRASELFSTERELKKLPFPNSGGRGRR